MRRQGEAELFKSKEQYRFLFDENPQPMWIFDVCSFQFLAFNTAALRHYGFTSEEFKNMTAKDLYPASEVEAFVADAAKTSELPFGGEVYKLTPAGEFFLTSSAEQKVRQFKSKEQAAVREYPGAKDWVLSAAFNLPTKRIAGGTFDGEVKVWNADDGKDVVTILAAPGLKK